MAKKKNEAAPSKKTGSNLIEQMSLIRKDQKAAIVELTEKSDKSISEVIRLLLDIGLAEPKEKLHSKLVRSSLEEQLANLTKELEHKQAEHEKIKSQLETVA